VPAHFIGEILLKLLHVLLVLDCVEQVPELVVELRQLADYRTHVDGASNGSPIERRSTLTFN
jgi:hypothetical protein